jgi:hypothetical protein
VKFVVRAGQSGAWTGTSEGRVDFAYRSGGERAGAGPGPANLKLARPRPVGPDRGANLNVTRAAVRLFPRCGSDARHGLPTDGAKPSLRDASGGASNPSALAPITAPTCVADFHLRAAQTGSAAAQFGLATMASATGVDLALLVGVRRFHESMQRGGDYW